MVEMQTSEQILARAHHADQKAEVLPEARVALHYFLSILA